MDKVITIYLAIINVAGLLFMLADKRRAKKNLWRIPEATLMGIAIVGGSIGSLMGMYLVRHKTQHPKFYIGIPVILAIQLILALVLSIVY